MSKKKKTSVENDEPEYKFGISFQHEGEDSADEGGKTLTNLTVFFSDKKSVAVFEKDLKWDKSIQEMSEQVEKLGGSIAKSVDQADIENKG